MVLAVCHVGGWVNSICLGHGLVFFVWVGSTHILLLVQRLKCWGLVAVRVSLFVVMAVSGCAEGGGLQLLRCVAAVSSAAAWKCMQHAALPSQDHTCGLEF